jgi:N-glycosylase/DNA lyase
VPFGTLARDFRAADSSEFHTKSKLHADQFSHELSSKLPRVLKDNIARTSEAPSLNADSSCWVLCETSTIVKLHANKLSRSTTALAQERRAEL